MLVKHVNNAIYNNNVTVTIQISKRHFQQKLVNSYAQKRCMKNTREGIPTAKNSSGNLEWYTAFRSLKSFFVYRSEIVNSVRIVGI